MNTLNRSSNGSFGKRANSISGSERAEMAPEMDPDCEAASLFFGIDARIRMLFDAVSIELIIGGPIDCPIGG